MPAITSESTYGAKKMQAEHAPAAHRPVEQQRDAERERALEDQREHDEDARCAASPGGTRGRRSASR